MLRSIGAVAAGFVTMAMLVLAGSAAIAAAVLPGGMAALREAQRGGTMPTPTPTLYALNIAMSLVAAFAGGWVTMRLSRHAPLGHLAALGAVVFLMGLVSAFTQSTASQPLWYKLLIPIVGVAGLAASARLQPGA